MNPKHHMYADYEYLIARVRCMAANAPEFGWEAIHMAARSDRQDAGIMHLRTTARRRGATPVEIEQVVHKLQGIE